MEGWIISNRAMLSQLEVHMIAYLTQHGWICYERSSCTVWSKDGSAPIDLEEAYRIEVESVPELVGKKPAKHRSRMEIFIDRMREFARLCRGDSSA